VAQQDTEKLALPYPTPVRVSALLGLPLSQCGRPVHDPKQVLQAHVTRGEDFAVHADPCVHAVAVLHLDPARNVLDSLRTEPVVVVVNE